MKVEKRSPFIACVPPILAILNELLFFFNSGKGAWDWSIFYVTLRWIVIPFLGILIGSMLVVWFSQSKKRGYYFVGSIISFGTSALLWLYSRTLFN